MMGRAARCLPFPGIMKRILSLAAALPLLGLPAAPARAQQMEPRILVTGTVADSVSGNPVFGVAIATTTTPDHTASDSTGAFTLSIPAGTTMVTFTGRGFQRMAQIVSGAENVALGRVALLPDAIALAPLEATVSLLDQRVHAYTGSTRVFDTSILNHAGAGDLLEFMRQRMGMRRTGCNTLNPASGGTCYRVRGSPFRPRVFVDEVQVSGMDRLELYRPEDVGRVEVFSGGAMVRVYTRDYLEMMARTNAQPVPLPPT